MIGKKGTNEFGKAKRLGLPKPSRPKEVFAKIVQSRKSNGKLFHSLETRKKISESRIKYLLENPDKIPYKLNHYSKGPSYPEIYWKQILDNNNIKYEEQFQVGTYTLDFAFLDLMIDLEIDGDQHYLDERVINSDIRRNSILYSKGWKIIRIRWSEYQKLNDKTSYVEYIINQLRTR